MSLWSRIWRRSIWIAIWLAVLVGVTIWSEDARASVAQSYGPWWLIAALIFLPAAALLLPIVLRTAEEASSRAVAEIIEGDASERPPLRRRLLAEGAVGLALGTATGLLAFLYGELSNFPGVWFSATFAIITGLAILLTVVVGSVLADTALRWSDENRRISGTALSSVAMVVATALYLGLALASSFLAPTLIAIGNA